MPLREITRKESALYSLNTKTLQNSYYFTQNKTFAVYSTDQVPFVPGMSGPLSAVSGLMRAQSLAQLTHRLRVAC
eukprot:3312493-Rhodomonas_salina.1